MAGHHHQQLSGGIHCCPALTLTMVCILRAGGRAPTGFSCCQVLLQQQAPRDSTRQVQQLSQ